MKISHYSVKHPVVIAMFIIALIAFGLYCIPQLSIEFIPDMSLPEVEVLTIYPGATAEEVEESVTSLLEDNFVTLPNYKSMKSQSLESLSWITIVYADGVDPYNELTELRYRIGHLTNGELPEGVQGEPFALVGGSTMLTIFDVGINGGKDVGRITEYLKEEIKPKLTRIEGVSDVNIVGGKETEVEIKLHLDELQSKAIPVVQVYEAIKAANVTIPLGLATYQEKSVNLSYSGKLENLEDIKNITVGMGKDNVIIKLSDVASVDYTYPEPEVIVSSNNKSMIMLQITKRKDADTLGIISSVKEVLDTINEDTNGALDYQIFVDDSKSIGNSLQNVITSGILGVLMAILAIFLFLNDGVATLIIAISIPLSIFFTFIGMQVLGQTINLISVSGIVVALGMIVDGSIVMLEQINRYMKVKDFSAEEAILQGSDEVGSSIVASNMTSIAVFIPMLFLIGIVGMIIKDFAITLILCLSASLLVSIIVVPFLISFFTKRKKRTYRKETIFLKGVNKVQKAYQKALGWSLTDRKFIVLLAIFVLGIAFCFLPLLGYTFIPSVDSGDFQVIIDFPTGYNIQQVDEKMKEAEEIVYETVKETSTTVLNSGWGDGWQGLGEAGKNHGNMTVKLIPRNERKRNVHEIMLELQKEISSRIPDVKVKMKNGGLDKLLGYVTGGGGYQIQLVGEDLSLLYETAQNIENQLKTSSEVLSTKIDTSYNSINLLLDASNEYLGALGLTSYESGVISSILFYGIDTGYMTQEDGNRYPIHLTSDAKDENLNENTLSKIQIKSQTGEMIGFDGLFTFSQKKAISSINHSERAKEITVSASLVSEDNSSVNTMMDKYFAQNPLPFGISVEKGGIMGLIKDSLPSLITVLIVAIFLVYMVMVIQFERFKQPLIVMFSVPFAMIGVILGLLAFHSSMSLMSFIGVVSLAGIVVNNAIILVDSINQLRDKKRAANIYFVDEDQINYPHSGYTSEIAINRLLSKQEELQILKESVVEGSASRMRPILMTTLTTLFGVIPMALGLGEGAELYAPTGQAICGGLLTSTIITMFLTPCVYFSFEKISLIRKNLSDLGGKNE